MSEPFELTTAETLRDAVEQEAAAAGAPTPTPFHLAKVLARSIPADFDVHFGAGAARRLLRPDARPLQRVDMIDTGALLAAAANSSLSEIAARLRESVPWITGYADVPPKETASEKLAQRHGLSGAVAEVAALVEPNTQVVGREAIVDEILNLICRKTPGTPLLIGKAGAGKTAVLQALASRMRTTPGLIDQPLVRIGNELLLRGNPADALDRALDSLPRDCVVAIDDLDAALQLGTNTVATPMLSRLRAAVEDPETRLILIIDERFADRLDFIDDELEHELARLEVEPLIGEALADVAARASVELSNYHGVAIPDQLVAVAATAPSPRATRVQPGLLIERLDAACTRAKLAGRAAVADEDLEIEEHDRTVSPLKSAALVAELQARVVGQPSAITAIARRLALTRSQLDLHPERPDGVFLLVGPTGVGKTSLARAVAEILFGAGDRLIRLDMSEYAEAWALSRIIGPHPGYVGSTQPESWLTTRILAEPECVLLLDEMEKAHAEVWNAFLQVFDDGRLTDSRGEIADFSKVVIMMTSNLGSDLYGQREFGFASGPTTASKDELERAVHRVVEEALPPELFNRLDAVLVFDPLSEERLAEIAKIELAKLCDRLAGRGYVIDFDPEVAPTLARLNYDPRYGARHLVRNIEQQLLEPLAQLDARILRAQVSDGAIAWHVAPPA